MNLKKYFDHVDHDPKLLVQAKIPKSLVKKLKPFMKEKNLNWNKLIKGVLFALQSELTKRK